MAKSQKEIEMNVQQIQQLIQDKVKAAFEAGKQAGASEAIQNLQTILQGTPAKRKGGRPKKVQAKVQAKSKGGRPKKGFSKNGKKLGRPAKVIEVAPASSILEQLAALSNGHNPVAPNGP